MTVIKQLHMTSTSGVYCLSDGSYATIEFLGPVSYIHNH